MSIKGVKRLPLHHWLEGDFLSESFELFHVSPDGMIFLPFLQIGGSELRVGRLSGTDVKADTEDQRTTATIAFL